MSKVREVKPQNKNGRIFFIETRPGYVYVACDGYFGLATQLLAKDAMENSGLERTNFGKNIETPDGFILFGHAYKRSLVDRLFRGKTDSYICNLLASYCCE
jgi:hypothetical protein